MPVRVIEHGPVDERTPVESFLRMAVKAYPHDRARKAREDAADPGEQLAGNHHVGLEHAQRPQDLQAVAGKAPQRAVVQCQHVFPGDDLQQVQHFAVPGEQQDMNGSAGVEALQPNEHRMCQHQAAHFREQNDQNPTRRLRNRWLRPKPVQE